MSQYWNRKTLENAAAALGVYAGINTRESFLLSAVGGQSKRDPADNSTEITKQPYDKQIIKNITDMVDGGTFGVEWFNWAGDRSILEKKVDGRSAGENFIYTGQPPADAASNILFKGATAKAGAVHSGPKAQGYWAKWVGVGSGAEKFNSGVVPSKTKPNISLLGVLSPSLNYGARDTGVTEVFMNCMPTMELSRAVPYVSMEIITGDPPLSGDKKISSMGLMNFLIGRSTVADGSVDQSLAAASTNILKATADAVSYTHLTLPTKRIV